MAKPNSLNVSVGKPHAAGGIYSGPTTIKAPTDATTALPEELEGLGHVSEEGLTNSIEMDTENIPSWSGDTVLTVRTSRTETFTWTFIETKGAVMKEVYGQNNVTTVGSGMTVLHKNEELPRRLYVFEILMTGNKVKRIVVPDSQITEIGEVVYVAGEPIGYPVTLTCFPDKDGVTVYEYIAEIEPEGK